MEHQCEWMPVTACEQENYNLLRQVILDYQRKPENLIQILHMAQAIFGFLPD